MEKKKTGQGRTFGSFSFCELSLQQINEKFRDQKTLVRVSRIWATQMGFDVVAKKSVDFASPTKVQSDSPSITVIDLDKTETPSNFMAKTVEPKPTNLIPASKNVLVE